MTTPDEDIAGTIVILTDVAPDGTYVLTVELDGDTARTLTPDEAHAWARTVLDAVGRAEYDAQVFQQMTGRLHMEIAVAANCVRELRADRPPLDDTATAPMRLEPRVNTHYMPIIAIHLNGTQVGQWTCTAAREHALGILEASSVVDLDAGYYRYLRHSIGADENTARATVGSLYATNGQQPTP